MSSSLSDVPSQVSPWQVCRAPSPYLAMPNNGESSRHAQTTGSRRSLPGPVERLASLSPAKRALKRSRDDTPILADESVRSTSIEQPVRQDASAPSGGGVIGGMSGEDGSTSTETAQRDDGPKCKGREGESEDNDAGESNLFSERTQPLCQRDLEDEEDEEEQEQEQEGQGEKIGAENEEEFVLDECEEMEEEAKPSETAKDRTTPTENLDNPISLEEGDYFYLDGQHHSLDVEVDGTIPAKATAADYIPRPFAAVSTTTHDPEIPSLTATGSNISEAAHIPRLPTPMDRMSRVIEEGLPFNGAYADEDDLIEEEVMYPDSYHSGDSDRYEMDHRPVMERTAVKKDIMEFMNGLQRLRDGTGFDVVDRLGEGTFSSVYLAYDIEGEEVENDFWDGMRYRTRLADGSLGGCQVALKRILATSSPARIHNELQILESLRNVSQLITAFREQDQVIIVMPYHQSDDFRYFYRNMDAFRISQYMRSLLQALKDIHQRGIVHRDVKPANFLFDYETCTGVLCDFGLAERYSPPRKSSCQHAPATLSSLHGSKQKTADTPAVEQAVYDARKRAKLGEGRVGFLHDDKRGSIKTNRAGTRGFRAPEVLLKCPDQTVAIDVWSAGIMLLSILTHKFPTFNSNDDIEALMELAAVFGRAGMERCAMLHNRTIICNVPTIDSSPNHIKDLILKLNPHIYTPPLAQPTSEEAKKHIQAMDKAIDLCARLLRLDATKRATADQALRHPFLSDYVHEEDVAEVEPLAGTEGKCGYHHEVDANGRHRAYFGKKLVDMHFGMGIPQSEDRQHEHFQERTNTNPLTVSLRFARPADEVDDDDEANELEVGEPEAPSVGGTPEKATNQPKAPTSADASAGTTTAMFIRDPAPTANQRGAGADVFAKPTTTINRNQAPTSMSGKRDVLSHMSLNKMAMNGAAVLQNNKAPAGVASGMGMGLSRFVGGKARDKEDEAIRAAARRRLV